MADWQFRNFVASFLKNFHGLRHGISRAADHRLMLTVDIGDYDVALHRFQDSLDFFQGREDGCHLAFVGYSHAGHSTAAGADSFQRILEGQSASSYQCSVFAQAVAHGHIGLNAISGEEAGECEIDSQHDRLSNSGLTQIIFGLGDGDRIGCVDENKFGERLAQQWRHHAIGFGKSRGDNGLCMCRADEAYSRTANLGRYKGMPPWAPDLDRGRCLARAAPSTRLADSPRAPSAPWLTCPPDRRHRHSQSPDVAERADRLQPELPARARARLEHPSYSAQTIGERGFRGSANHKRAAQRRLAGGAVEERTAERRDFFRVHDYLIHRSLGESADSDRPLAISGQPVRNVLFEHEMEVGAAKTKGADPGATRSVGRHGPRLQFGIDVKRRVGKVDVGAGMFAMHAGRQYFIPQRQRGFQQPGSARRSFEMADVRLDRAQRHRVVRKMLTAEQIRHALRFDHVAHASGCAVALNQRRGGGREAGILARRARGRTSGRPDWAR